MDFTKDRQKKNKILISCAKTSYTGLKNNIKEKRNRKLSKDD